jgi:HEAT repeat protein
MLAPKSGDDAFAAIDAIVRIGPLAKPLVPGLTATLKNKTPYMRIHAAEALGNVGPDAKDAVPALRELLKDSRDDVRRAAEKALKKIETK